MSNEKKIILPGEENNQPLVMGDAYQGEHLPPKIATAKRNAEFDKQREHLSKETGYVPYPNSAIAQAPDSWYPGMIKSAQAAGGGVNNVMTNPMWFSPLHTAQNWQIASKRREVYQWMNINTCQLTTYDYTCRAIADLEFEYEEQIEDIITGGILFNGLKSEPVLAGKGEFSRPVKFSIRQAVDKPCFGFRAYGYWRSVDVSEEHHMIVLDGITYRHKLKLSKDSEYRRSKGINSVDKPNIEFSKQLITRKKASDITLDDYLLAPVPSVGSSSINYSDAWLLGLCIADGSISKRSNLVGYTINKNEKFSQSLQDHLYEWGAVNVTTHYNSSSTYRICVSNKQFHELCSKYIVGTLTEKRFTADLFNFDKESRLHVLGGYFDGDGSFMKKEHKLVANCYSCDMTDQIYWLLISVGIRASIGKYQVDTSNHYKTDSEWYYRIFIPSSDVPKLQPYMRSDKIPTDYVPKKSRQLRFFYEEDGVKYLAQPIKSIKQFKYTGPGYDIQIDPERSFVASGYVTSNCRFFYENEAKVAAAIDFYCYVPQTQVLMADGTQKSISSIVPGELVRSHTGKINRVLKTFSRYTNEDILKISYAGVTTEKLKVTLGHKMLTERDGQIKYVHAEELKIGDVLLTPCDYDAIGDWQHEQVDDFAYLVGAYAAEGCGMPYEHISNRGRKTNYYKGIKFSISKNEIGFQKSIIAKINRLYGACKISVINQKDNTTSIRVYGRSVADDLIGICPGTSSDGTKRIMPYIFNKWNAIQLASFIAGFYDGDGCYQTHGQTVGMGVCKRLLEQVANILDKLGIEYSFARRRPTGMGRQQVYYANIPHRELHKFKHLSAKSTNGWDKHDQYYRRNWTINRKDKFIHRTISKIEKCKYKGIVHDLEIENDHSYIVNRIATSNSQFPMNGFEFECKSRKISKWFKHFVSKRLNLNEVFKQISSEYFTLGDVFVHGEIECPICNGSAINPETNEICNHPGGTFRKIIVLNPDWIEVQQTPIVDDPNIIFIPDEELKRIVFYKQPKNIYDKIPDGLKELIIQNKPISLSNRTTSHIKHMPIPYGTYGTSIIRRLFTTLAYKTKIMTANWVVAERLILPVRVVKIGSDNRPASSADISDVQQQLAATVNDPNLTIVTHHNFDYEYYGACHDEQTEVLTDSGFKTYDKVLENDEIACFDTTSSCISFQKPLAKHVYDYSGYMCKFSGKRVDILVTPNHKMLVSRDGKNWETEFARDVKPNCKFLSTPKLFKTDISYPVITIKDNHFIDIDGEIIDCNTMMKLIGYYISEGSASISKSNWNISIYQSSKKQKCFADIKNTCKDTGLNFSDYSYRESEHRFCFSNKSLTQFMINNFGHLAQNKYIPNWVKNLPKKYLKTLLDAMFNGDGHDRSGKYCNSNLYSSTSKSLIDDVQEIAFKCGFSCRTYNDGPQGFGKLDLWRAHISEGKFSNGAMPLIKKQHISKEFYNGKVWCFTVPTGFFVTRRNGKITIQGNSGKILQVTQEMEHIDKEILDGMMLNQSLLNGEMSGYQSAAVGVETLIRRIESWRQKLAEWCEEKIFKPIAEMQGFIDEEESKEIGETVYLYPKIKWNDLNLKDNTQFNQLLMQLHDKQVLSTQTLLEKLHLNYDQEIKRRRFESVQIGPGGAMMGGGGMGGGMGGMGGGMGGGAPGAGAGPMPEGMSPMGGMGGDMGGMGGMGGGGMPGADGLGPGPMASNKKIMKKGKEDKSQEQQIMAVNVPLTQIEQKMAGTLMKVANNLGISSQHIRLQFPIENPKGGKPFTLDFAFPKLKIGVEADGEIWHDTEEQKAGDKERDMLLAQRGWTILRFDDKVIEDAIQEVESTIASYLQKAIKSPKHASKGNDTGFFKLFSSEKNHLVDMQGDYIKYARTIE